MACTEFGRTRDRSRGDLVRLHKKGNYEILLHNDTDSTKYNHGFQIRPPVLTLVDLTAKIVSKHLPYSYVERKCVNVPERIAGRIMFWSFPRCHTDIMRYYFDSCGDEYYPLCALLETTFVPYRLTKCSVKCIVQIGFCFLGIVSDECKDFHVSLTLDRCIVTSVKCSCSEERVLWCTHAITLAMYRLNFGTTVEVYMPIFTRINQLDRDQLQKLLQYLLSKRHDHISGMVQNIQNELSSYRPSCLQQTSWDTQDVTAFLGSEDIPSWFFDIRNISSISSFKFCKFIGRLLKRVIDMMSANDRNGLKIFQFLVEERINLGDVIPDNELIKLWTFTLAAPHISKEEKDKYCSLIDMWLLKENSWQEDFPQNNEFIRNNALLPFVNNSIIPTDIEKESINAFLMPLCAGRLSWDDKQLKLILSRENISLERDSVLDTHQQLIWREHFPTSCVRVRALQASGYHLEAVRLSLAIARAIKDQSKRWKEIWSEIQLSRDANDINAELVEDVIKSADGEWMNLSFIKHRAEPLEILFSSLVNAPKITKDQKIIPLLDSQCYQVAIEAIIVIFSQRLILDDTARCWEDEILEEKWMKIVSNALQDQADCEHAILNSSSCLLDYGAIRDLIETLLQAGLFTSCGNFTYFAVPRYNWGLLMTRAIYIFDKDLAAKFALSCLRFHNRSELPKKRYLRIHNLRYKLLRFVVSEFPENVGIEALDISLKQEDIASITNLTLNLCFCRSHEIEFMSETSKDYVFRWLLEILHSSLFSSREISGNRVLEVATHVGFQQTVHLLKNWEEYIQVSESMDLNVLHSTFYGRFSSEEKALIKDEGYKLALRFVENEKEEKELIFKCLKILLSDPAGYYRYNGILIEEEWNTLNRKLFELGLGCAETKPRPFILQKLPALVLDESTGNTYCRLLLDALQQGTIDIGDILIIDNVSRYTDLRYPFTNVIKYSQHCKYNLQKLSVKYFEIPINYKIQRRTTDMIDRIISVAQEAHGISESEAIEIVTIIIENVKNTPVLFRIIKGCYEFCVEESTKPYWMKKLFEDGLRISESDTFRRMRGSQKSLANHYKRIDEIRNVLHEEYN